MTFCRCGELCNDNSKSPFIPDEHSITGRWSPRSGLIKPKLQGIFVPSPPKARNVCQKCNKRLSGKLVRLPDSKERYHWSCLKREDSCTVYT
ncbi:hypothetical protein RO3G_10311 [Rhizopus delemar RA 99-880]|uniref:Uncharacterized protein n=1 Tax=Rhizopus delemar (strain RA 99-880 / ATCC MYA-4621 / FGSC 9543 / NRRL 43880) TaxID=246409 RepID=I1CAX1_RHIO9|nr:hypothetical protein RO3G_10311 [Rhizopus delemar RA 99-880]|eukprot:EIE85601.1 hypothetical protein RO3G_10311 [Rhizopus delemar RA 99-880]